jgi:alpha-beta hydrolase superfamily lysophospholipase
VLELRRTDPLVHDRITPRLYFGIVEARARVLRDARRLGVPALLLQGAADKVVDPHGALEFTGMAPHDLVRLLTYHEGFHEVFNDPARAQAIPDLIGWLDAIVVV